MLGYPKGGFSDFAGAAAGTKAHGAGPYGLPLPWLAPPGQSDLTVAVGRVRLLSANPSRGPGAPVQLHTPGGCLEGTDFRHIAQNMPPTSVLL